MYTERRNQLFLVLLASVCGCASIDVSKVGGGFCSEKGFRYYLPHPYVLVAETPAEKGDSILFQAVSDTLTESAPRLALRIKSEAFTGRMIRLDVVPPNAAIIENKNKDPLEQVKSNGSPVDGAYVWKAGPDPLALKLAGLHEVLLGSPLKLTISAVGIYDSSLKGRTSVEVRKKPDSALEAVATVAANKPPAKAKLTMSIIYLPDKTEMLAVKPTPGFGTASATLTLKDGWMLTNVNSAADSKIPETLQGSAAVISSLAELAPVATFLDATGKVKAAPEPLAPGLYALAFDEERGYFTGLVPVVRALPEP